MLKKRFKEMLIESRVVFFFFAIPNRRNPSLARLLFNSVAGSSSKLQTVIAPQTDGGWPVVKSTLSIR